MNAAIKYVADVAHVREVSLRGSADLDFWKDRLQKEDLAPAAVDGRAQVLIMAADARFRGVRFREVSFTVLVDPGKAWRGQDAGFLLRAFNSNRFFAFCERAFFATPYYPADVVVSAGWPASIQLSHKGRVAFRADMTPDLAASKRTPLPGDDAGWDGPVSLPGDPGRKAADGKLFFARVSGRADRYQFVPSEDRVVLNPGADDGVVQALVDSGFTPGEWITRPEGRHAKSKTYARSKALTSFGQAPRG